MNAKLVVDDVRRCLHFDSMYICEYIGKAAPDGELGEYLLDLVGENLKVCECRLESLITARAV